MSRLSVLIVDDDADIRELLAETLACEGFEVSTAANGLEGLQLLRSRKVRPSVILLDLMMPIMDGYAFLEHRHLDPALASIPVAIVTAGHGVNRDRLWGAFEVVRKPFDVPRLLGLLRAVESGGVASA
jgi:CheY-like chemotaxis protein